MLPLRLVLHRLSFWLNSGRGSLHQNIRRKTESYSNLKEGLHRHTLMSL